MSKLTSVLNQSNMRRDNYSVDIKDLRRATTYFSPFAKKKLDSQILKRNKTPSHFISTQNSRKELVKKNRKFSLSKSDKI